MEFRYGIPAKSLARWEAFERISVIQEERGPEAGASLMRYIIDAELETIAQATAARERSVEALAARFRTGPSGPAPVMPTVNPALTPAPEETRLKFRRNGAVR